MARLGPVKVWAILLIVFTGLTFYQRRSMECSIARKNSAHFERVYNEVQGEVADFWRKYDGESARAEECNAKVSEIDQNVRLCDCEFGNDFNAKLSSSRVDETSCSGHWSYMIRDVKQKTEELDEALAQRASAHRDNLKHVDEITELNAELSRLPGSTVDDVAMRNRM